MKTSDAVIYLDPDTVVLNSIEKLWSHFQKFDDKHMIAMSLLDDIAEGNNYRNSVTFSIFGKLGINNGVMLMNLTRMRRFNFAAKIMKTWERWKKFIKHGDQDLTNILLHDHPGV